MIDEKRLVEAIKNDEYCNAECCRSFSLIFCETAHYDCPMAIINYIKQMEGKTCESCKHYESRTERTGICRHLGFANTYDFYCGDWEVSEEDEFIWKK